MSTPLSRFALRNFVVYNPLFAFSAALVLAGAWLINPPASDGGRSVALLLRLLGVIQLYQLCLLGAGSLLARRTKLERDVRFLATILGPFLLDVTFTTSSLMVSVAGEFGLAAALGLGCLSLGLTAIEFLWATRLVGLRYDRLATLAFLAVPACVLALPPIAHAMALAGFSGQIGIVAGSALAGLVLLFGRAAEDKPSRTYLRRLACLALVAFTLHAFMTTWTYSGNLLHVLGPGLIAVAPVLPRLVPALQPFARPALLLLPALGVWLTGLAPLEPASGAWPLATAFAAGVYLAGFLRHKQPLFLVPAFVAIEFATGGLTLAESLAIVGKNPLEPAVLCGVFLWALWRKSALWVQALPLLGAGALVVSQTPFGAPFDGVLVAQALGFGLLAASHRLHGCSAAGSLQRLWGTALSVVPPWLLVAQGGPAAADALLLAWGATAVLLCLGLVTRLLTYGAPTLIVLARALSLPAAPASAQGWGVIVLAAGFACVCGGVLLSLQRERLLAWIDSLEDEEEEDSLAYAPSPFVCNVPQLAAILVGCACWFAIGYLP